MTLVDRNGVASGETVRVGRETEEFGPDDGVPFLRVDVVPFVTDERLSRRQSGGQFPHDAARSLRRVGIEFVVKARDPEAIGKNFSDKLHGAETPAPARARRGQQVPGSQAQALMPATGLSNGTRRGPIRLVNVGSVADKLVMVSEVRQLCFDPTAELRVVGRLGKRTSVRLNSDRRASDCLSARRGKCPARPSFGLFLQPGSL